MKGISHGADSLLRKTSLKLYCIAVLSSFISCSIERSRKRHFTALHRVIWLFELLRHENLTGQTARFVPNAVWPGCYILMTWLKHSDPKQRLAVFGHVDLLKLKHPTQTSATKHRVRDQISSKVHWKLKCQMAVRSLMHTSS